MDQRIFHCSDCDHEWPRVMGEGHSLIGQPNECPCCKSTNIYNVQEAKLSGEGRLNRQRGGRYSGGIGRGQSRGCRRGHSS